MPKKGKQLEQIMLLIQQVFKDSSNTSIIANQKLLTESGEAREFDLVIRTEINGFKLCIVIECKDHLRPVEAGLVEAFYAKCNRVKEISKMVFISSNGFQSGAITSATYYGIELHTLREISPEDISRWVPIKQLDLGLNFSVQALITSSGEQGETSIASNEIRELYLKNSTSPIHIVDFLGLVSRDQKPQISELSMNHYVACLNNPALDKELIIPFRVDLENTFIFNEANQRVPLIAIECLIDARVLEVPANIEQIKTYQPLAGDANAHYLKAKMAGDDYAEFVLSKDKVKGFYHGSGEHAPYMIHIAGPEDTK